MMQPRVTTQVFNPYQDPRRNPRRYGLSGKGGKGEPRGQQIASVLPYEEAMWFGHQSEKERKTMSEIVRRAMRFERARLEALGDSATEDELEHGRV
jgi:hypothetical protein